MRLPSLVTSVVSAAVLALALTTGCSSGEPDAGAPSATPTPPPTATPAPVPAVDVCYNLAYDAALAPTSDTAAIPCTESHTVVSFHVGQAATFTPDGHLLAIDSRRVRDQMAAECPTRFAAYVGGSDEDRRLSMLAPTWFGPTLKQSDQGQSWFRCDVMALASEGTLAPLDASMAQALAQPEGRAKWGRCATANPGTAGAQQVICSTNSAWVAVATIDVAPAADNALPDATALGNAGAACQDRVRDRAKDKLSFTWGWTPPTQAQWDSGQHYGFCWAPGNQ